MLEIFRKLGSIQFDPLAVAGRSHDLVLHARVADYDPGWCDLLYERREIFEAYNKGLSLVPSSEFAWFRGTLSRTAPRILAENAEVAERVLERIRADGPVSALDFERERGGTTDWFGMPTNAVRAVLEAYAVTGRSRPRAARRQPPVLRPPRTAATRRRARSRCAAERATPTQASVPVPCPRSARRRRRCGHLRRPRVREARARDTCTRGEAHCARSWSSSESSFPSRSRACAANA